MSLYTYMYLYYIRRYIMYECVCVCLIYVFEVADTGSKTVFRGGGGCLRIYSLIRWIKCIWHVRARARGRR